MKPVERAAVQFEKLPGVGIKTAKKLAYALLMFDKRDVDVFCDEIAAAKDALKLCRVCGNFSEGDVCEICAASVAYSADTAPKRDGSIVCVVEHPKDIAAIERGRYYKGVYYVLHGLISPTNLKLPKDLNIKGLLERENLTSIREIILATPPTLDGEATARYVTAELLAANITARITRLAYGMSVGGSFDYADDDTLSYAFKNRNTLE
ncbi:MAG: recombination mediator RecR [Oscillospiraceae bacterium]|nr:recombination mediator RecR [Oscillospiraceae bacterium]